MNREALIRYAQIKSEMTKLENDLEMLKPIVEVEIKEAVEIPGESYVSLPEIEALGKYGLAKTRPKWQFSATVQDIESDLEEMKKTEIAIGKAINLNEGKYDVRFIQPKTEKFK